ncbi:hypothetical protein ASPFODRAFT_212809 [Aspergillus luchuensis CBS 106.47]|uniref:FAD-binding FR-type domain-containing protein n=1 Tax=Aspergillus luchuensis (strain CBS 106.47) TaxID=1137211 RepID=A0A1M3T0H3_ASPLC|nr:hypothetical protein ASPFODRAFT_212809 [Aspergillus luchuensis CBS 106.47]
MAPALSDLYEQASQIQSVDWYGIWIAILLGVWLIARLAHRLGRWTVQCPIAVSLGRRIGHELPWLAQTIDISTAFEVILVGVLLGANIVLLLVSAHGWADVQQRAAKLAVLNLLPLGTGLTFGLPAHLLGISRSAVAWLHRWFGRVMAAHSLLHGAIAIARADNPIPSMRHDWVALLAAAAILMIIPVTLHVVVRRHCQVAMRIHYLLAVTAMVALAYHTWDRGSDSRWQVVGAGALWIVLSFVAVSHAVFVQQRWSAGRPAVTIRPFYELLRMDITVSPHWHIRPGQYVYLWLPHAGFRSCCQLQPFYVAYWDDALGPRILYVLTRPRASSLSTRLYLREWLHQRRQPALLLGPYGRSIDFSLFGTIVFIVEDIGMLRVLPYIRMLVHASEERRAMVRKLKIVWQMQDFDHQCWLGDWMQDLLDLDRSEFKILEFRLYYLTKTTSVDPGDVFGERIKLCQGPLMAGEIVQAHLSKRRGKLAVGVCARQSIRQQVQDVVQPRTGPDIKFFDLDLGPGHVREAPCRNKDTATASASSDS